MAEKLSALKPVVRLYLFLLVVWGFYRLLFKLPDEVEELILKPLIWLGAVAYFLKKEGGNLSSLGFSQKNLFKSIYLALGLGVLFAAEGALVNALKYGGTSFLNLALPPAAFLGALGLSLATSISEETTFRGFIFNRIWKTTGREWYSNLLTTAGWVLIHLPITFFVLKYTPGQIAVFLFLTGLFSLGSGFVFARTGNVLSSILLHVLWEWPIILFR